MEFLRESMWYRVPWDFKTYSPGEKILTGKKGLRKKSIQGRTSQGSVSAHRRVHNHRKAGRRVSCMFIMWDSLNLLDKPINVFNQIGHVSSHYFFIYFFCLLILFLGNSH